MKFYWKQIRKSIINEVKPIFDASQNPANLNLEAGVDLFKNILGYKTGIKNFDGLHDPVLDALETIYSKPGEINNLKAFLNNLEPFLKKIIYLLTNENYSTDFSKNLMVCLKDLTLLNRNSEGRTPQLDEACITQYKNNPHFLEHVCRTYVRRNDVHNGAHLTNAEIYSAAASGLTVYIYTCLKFSDQISAIIGTPISQEVHIETYRKHAESILSYNLSLKMLEADFGIRIDSLETFEVEIRAKSKKHKEEREEYLKEKGQYNIIPFKLLPEIEGVISTHKSILLHGIATSGKTTILKKLGRDFLEKFQSPYLFYLELGEIFKKQSALSVLEQLQKRFKEVSSLELDLSTVNDKILILLDGLDEVPLKESRDTILEQIIELKKYANIQIVITSRSNDYITNNPLIDDSFEKFELLPITMNDMLKIGQRILGNDTQFSCFVKMIKKSSLLKAFPKTPLTSILLAILVKETDINIRELPKNITELYGKFIDLFLNRWDKTKGISEQFEIQKKEFVLQTIAEHMQKNRLISISESALVDFITELASKKHIGGPKEPITHLTNLCDRTNILIKDEFNGTYRFFHLTIQEFLAAQKLTHKDDTLLVQNFYDEWWLNSNIFYAGNKTDYPDVLKRVAGFEYYPADAETKFNYIAHSSQVLLAAHNLDNDVRLDLLTSMVKVFDEFSKEFIEEIVAIPNTVEGVNPRLTRLRNQSILDIILTLRAIFLEFFSFEDFVDELRSVWNEIVYGKNKVDMCDTTLYCMSYCLAIRSKEAFYLEDFVLTDNVDINSRWFKIVDVDISINKLEAKNKKITLKIRNVASKNSDYIRKQFTERIKRHYESLTGMK